MRFDVGACADQGCTHPRCAHRSCVIVCACGWRTVTTAARADAAANGHRLKDHQGDEDMRQALKRKRRRHRD